MRRLGRELGVPHSAVARAVCAQSPHQQLANLQTSLRLAKMIPEDRLFVVESGIHTKDDVQLLLDAGADAFLIGEHFLTSADPAAAIRGLS